MAIGLQRCLGYQGERCGVLVKAPRCDRHRAVANRAKLAERRQRRPDFRKDEARRRATVEAWRAEHGDWCPGDETHPPHVCVDTNPLTADHLVPPALGGDERGPLRVVCHRRNTGRGQSA